MLSTIVVAEFRVFNVMVVRCKKVQIRFSALKNHGDMYSVSGRPDATRTVLCKAYVMWILVIILMFSKPDLVNGLCSPDGRERYYPDFCGFVSRVITRRSRYHSGGMLATQTASCILCMPVSFTFDFGCGSTKKSHHV